MYRVLNSLESWRDSREVINRAPASVTEPPPDRVRMGTRVHLYPRLFRACPVRVAKLLAVTHGDARAGAATKGALCSTRYRPLVGALGGGGGGKRRRVSGSMVRDISGSFYCTPHYLRTGNFLCTVLYCIIYCIKNKISSCFQWLYAIYDNT